MSDSDAPGNRPLWAPWRIKFIRSPKDGECFLCGKKENRDSPDESLVVARLEHVFVILNRYPYNSGHLMIAPFRHVADLPALTKRERHELMDAVVDVEKIVSELMNPDGFNVGFNLGSAAGAGVKDHLHLHVVPRWHGDNNFMPVLANARVVPEALEETADMIRGAWTRSP